MPDEILLIDIIPVMLLYHKRQGKGLISYD